MAASGIFIDSIDKLVKSDDETRARDSSMRQSGITSPVTGLKHFGVGVAGESSKMLAPKGLGLLNHFDRFTLTPLKGVREGLKKPLTGVRFTLGLRRRSPTSAWTAPHFSQEVWPADTRGEELRDKVGGSGGEGGYRARSEPPAACNAQTWS